jgi:hypothetical protein
MALRAALCPVVRFQDYVGFRSLTTSFALPEHADRHSPEYPVVLAVDQTLAEGSGLGVALVRRNEDVINVRLTRADTTKRRQACLEGRP